MLPFDLPAPVNDDKKMSYHYQGDINSHRLGLDGQFELEGRHIEAVIHLSWSEPPKIRVSIFCGDCFNIYIKI